MSSSQNSTQLAVRSVWRSLVAGAGGAAAVLGLGALTARSRESGEFVG